MVCFDCFLDVCPEPVLVECSAGFKTKRGAKPLFDFLHLRAEGVDQQQAVAQPEERRVRRNAHVPITQKENKHAITHRH
jgi:hypothetical protein